MTAQEIRQAFLEFFKEKQHHIVPSAPIVVKKRSNVNVYQCGDESI